MLGKKRGLLRSKGPFTVPFWKSSETEAGGGQRPVGSFPNPKIHPKGLKGLRTITQALYLYKLSGHYQRGMNLAAGRLR